MWEVSISLRFRFVFHNTDTSYLPPPLDFVSSVTINTSKKVNHLIPDSRTLILSDPEWEVHPTKMFSYFFKKWKVIVTIFNRFFYCFRGESLQTPVVMSQIVRGPHRWLRPQRSVLYVDNNVRPETSSSTRHTHTHTHTHTHGVWNCVAICSVFFLLFSFQAPLTLTLLSLCLSLSLFLCFSQHFLLWEQGEWIGVQ